MVKHVNCLPNFHVSAHRLAKFSCLVRETSFGSRWLLRQKSRTGQCSEINKSRELCPKPTSISLSKFQGVLWKMRRKDERVRGWGMVLRSILWVWHGHCKLISKQLWPYAQLYTKEGEEQLGNRSEVTRETRGWVWSQYKIHKYETVRN